MNAGRELDILIAEHVFGLVRCTGRKHNAKYPNTYCYAKPDSPDRGAEVREYSTDMVEAWDVVREVQRQHPGWRFCLLGGDVSMGYVADSQGGLARDDDRNLIVAEDTRLPFGWNAEFMGHEDPRLNTGKRHGDQKADTAPLAICLAALQAIRGGSLR